MALDTQQKRMSALGAGKVFVRARFPSGVNDEAARKATGMAYSGNALSAPAVSGERARVQFLG